MPGYEYVDASEEFSEYTPGVWFECDPDEDEDFGADCGFEYANSVAGEEVWFFEDVD